MGRVLFYCLKTAGDRRTKLRGILRSRESWQGSKAVNQDGAVQLIFDDEIGRTFSLGPRGQVLVVFTGKQKNRDARIGQTNAGQGLQYEKYRKGKIQKYHVEIFLADPF